MATIEHSHPCSHLSLWERQQAILVFQSSSWILWCLGLFLVSMGLDPDFA
jgi:hypothetical protein